MADAKKWISVGLRFVPYIGQVINAVESVKVARGPEKAAAVKDAVTVGLAATEFAFDRDLLIDAKVQEAVSRYTDAYVALQNAIAHAQVGIDASKAARVTTT